MQGITIFQPTRHGAMPEYFNHTDAVTRRSVERLKELIEDFGEELDAAIIYKALTKNDLARIVTFMVESKYYDELKTINIDNYEIV